MCYRTVYKTPNLTTHKFLTKLVLTRIPTVNTQITKTFPVYNYAFEYLWTGLGTYMGSDACNVSMLAAFITDYCALFG